MSEKLHAAAKRQTWPFVHVAAWVKRRTYRSADKLNFDRIYAGICSPVTRQQTVEQVTCSGFDRGVTSFSSADLIAKSVHANADTTKCLHECGIRGNVMRQTTAVAQALLQRIRAGD